MRFTLPVCCVVLPAVLFAAPAAKDEAAQQSWQAEKLFDESRFAAAVKEYAASIPALTSAFGEANPRTLIAINNYAAALLQINRAAEAEAALRDALDRRERAGLGEDSTLAASWSNLGDALLLGGRVKAAVAMHERALALRERLYNAGNPEIASSMTSLAEALRQSGEFTRARALFEQSAALWAAPAKGKTGAAALPIMPGYARNQNSLGLLLDAESNRKPAETAYLQALHSSMAAYGPMHEFTATLQFNLAGHYAQYSDWKRAEEHCRKALDVFELRPEFHDDQLAQALELHAEILEHLRGRKREAKAQRQRAGAILSLQ